MKRNSRKQIAFLLAGLFVCLNISLLIFHNDSIYEKKAYIEEWGIIARHDLKETVVTEGTYQPADETTVFFDPSQGTYMQTLVEENEQVQKDDPLIEYKIDSYENTQEELETQLDQLEGEITAVESTLAQLERVTISENEQPDIPFGPNEETPDEETVPETNDSATPAYLKEQFRLETEEKLARLQAKESAVETQLAQLETKGQSLSVLSPVSGTVRKIDGPEGDPVITISSNELIIEGTVDEENRKRLEQGMAVEISGAETDGEVDELSEYPESASSEVESNYAFQVAPKEAVEEVLPGYHTALEFILAERLNAPSVHEDQLAATVIPSVWVMDENGRLSYREIETGLEMNSWQEVVSGAEAGEQVVESPGDTLENDLLFVTPLETRFLDWSLFASEKNAFFREYPLLAGLLHR